MTPKAVIFDCDGVIVDSERLSNQVMRDDLAGRGLDLPLDDIMAHFVGSTMTGVATKAADLGADIPENWLDMIDTKIHDTLADKVELIPGVLTVLDMLDRAGVPYGVASNGSLTKMQVTLGRTGILHRMTGRLFSSQSVPNPKPAPDVFWCAAQGLGVDPTDCVVVEDSLSGAVAGRAAGMTVCGFTRDSDAAKMGQIADVVFDDFAQFFDLPVISGLGL